RSGRPRAPTPAPAGASGRRPRSRSPPAPSARSPSSRTWPARPAAPTGGATTWRPSAPSTSPDPGGAVTAAESPDGLPRSRSDLQDYLRDLLGGVCDDALLEQALTHRSYAYENGGLPHNERLE